MGAGLETELGDKPFAHARSVERFVSPRRAWLEQAGPTILYRGALAIILVFIIAPIAVVILTSLSSTRFLEFPPSGLSLQWWRAALSSEWLVPIWFSLRLAAATSIVAAVLGTLAAFAIVRANFPGRDLLNTFLLSPLLIPQIITGIAILQYLSFLDLRDLIGFPALVLGHVVVTIPYVMRTAMVSLAGFDTRLEWAARDLGAGSLQTFWHVTLPLVKNGAFAGAVFAFIVSFNDVPISLFLNRPGQVPIPIAILNYMEFRFDPALSAVAVITIAIVVGLIAIGQRFARVSEFIYQQD